MVLPLRVDQEEHLLKLCEEMGRTPEDFVREAVLTFMEDYEDGRDAEAALAEAGPRYTQEEMEKESALEGRVLGNLQKTA
jgi:predicted DNA-binding protein